MLKEFKNVKVGYIPDCEVEINNKKYLIHGVVDGENIIVDTNGNYPKLMEVTNQSIHRIKNGCPYQNECGGCQFQHISYEYELEKKSEYINDLIKSFKLKNKISLESKVEI